MRYPVSANAVFVQAIHPKTQTSDTKQALYNLFAVYIHTVLLEELIESVERSRRDAQLRYVGIYGTAALRRRPRNYHKVYLKMH
jgi:hypothetical protein